MRITLCLLYFVISTLEILFELIKNQSIIIWGCITLCCYESWGTNENTLCEKILYKIQGHIENTFHYRIFWIFPSRFLQTFLMENLIKKLFFAECWPIKIIVIMKSRIAGKKHSDVSFSLLGIPFINLWF